MSEVDLYTDGACSGNPGAGGYGVVLIYGSHTKELSGAYRETTNNRMELMAVIQGLAALKKPCLVNLYSDSRYIVDAMNKDWVKRWKFNNWMRNKNEPAKNIDLWKQILELAGQHQIRWNWVKGHASNTYNNRCDQLAREAITSQTQQPDLGYKPD